MEIWKDVPWYEWKYQISNLWNVKSLNFNKSKKEKLLKLIISFKWYYVVWLHNKTQKMVSVHRLISLCFIPNPLDFPHINHIDWNKLNNSIENLEWCTASENQKHAYRIWLRKRITK